MRPSRRITACLAVVMLTGLLCGSEAPASSFVRARTRGTVLVPTSPSPIDMEVARCAWLAGGGRSRGIIGYAITLRSGVYDHHRFAITAEDGALREQHGSVAMSGPTFSVAFYRERMSGCGDVSAPLEIYHGDGAITTGHIPFGAKYVLVTLTGTVVNAPTCYTLPPVCSVPGRLPTVTVRASEEPGPEPFLFTIYRW